MQKSSIVELKAIVPLRHEEVVTYYYYICVE